MTVSRTSSRASLDIDVRPVRLEDIEPITDIYNHYIARSVISFEQETIAPGEMAERVRSADPLPWLVAEHDGTVIGYAYAGSWKGRCAYQQSVEVTVYLSPDSAGRGAGSALYRRLLSELRQAGVHTAIGGIALPNDASVALHEKFGFRKVAHFAEVGRKFDRWIDVGYWQLIL